MKLWHPYVRGHLVLCCQCGYLGVMTYKGLTSKCVSSVQINDDLRSYGNSFWKITA